MRFDLQLAILLSYVWGVWRYRWRALITAWLVGIGGWLYVYQIPSMYQSYARVYVDTQSVLEPLLAGLTVETEELSVASLMTRVVLNRENLSKIADETDLYLDTASKTERENLLSKLARDIRIGSAGERNYYAISYQHTNPEKAQLVVQALLSRFMESSLGHERDNTGMAERFLDEQVREYESRLEESENKLKEFKQRYAGMMPDQGVDYYQRLQRATADLEEAQSELREVTGRVEELRAQIVGEEPTFGFATNAPVDSPAMRALDEQISETETELADLILDFTEKHPDVIAKRTILDLLEKQKADEVAKLRQTRLASEPSESEVYKRLRIELGITSSEAAALKTRVKERQAKVDRLKGLVDTIPKVEADLAKLTRSYNIIKQQYESLLVRSESARLTREAEQSADEMQFNVIEPPRVPLTPAWPNRILLATGVLLAAIGSGIGVAFLFSRVNVAFYETQTLAQVTGRPILGTVSKIDYGRSFDKVFGSIFYTLGCLGLFGLYGGLVLLTVVEIDISWMLDQVL